MTTNNCHFHRFQGPPEVVIPPELCDWWWRASGGSAPSEKTRPGFFEHVSCEFSRCSWIWGLPFFFFWKWTIWSNDYASKTRIEILCTMACYKTANHFPKSEFSSNSWILRTLVWMSTWRIEEWRRRRRRRANKCHAPQPPASNHAQGSNIPFRGNPSLWYTYFQAAASAADLQDMYIYIYSQTSL